MLLLSIDVGIKNLALCCINRSTSAIIKWEVIDLSQADILQCNSHLCNAKVCWRNNNDHLCYCNKHANQLVPKHLHLPKQFTESSLKKMSVAQLREIIHQFDTTNIYKTKKQIFEAIGHFKKQQYLEEIKPTNASTLDFITISRNITNKLNVFLQDIHNVDYIIIENQMGKIASRMKTMQGMLVQYFTMSLPHVENIEFVSAMNKLKELNIPKEEMKNYSQRKKIGIVKCLEFLQMSNNIEYVDYFQQHKKKDDLSDSLLQGLWFINR